jgi:hypothetical protein
LWQSQTFCARQKDDLHSVKLFFCAGTKDFEEALNIVKFLGWFKKFGLAQNILGPEKGQGINVAVPVQLFKIIIPRLFSIKIIKIVCKTIWFFKFEK